MTDDDVTDHKAILTAISEDADRFQLMSVAADPNNAWTVLTDLVNDHGIATYEFRQTFANFNEPIKHLLEYLADPPSISQPDEFVESGGL